MPNDLRVRAGPLVAIMPENGITITDQQMENNIMAFCRAKELETEGLTKQQILTMFTQYVWNWVRITAKQQLMQEKKYNLENSINTEITNELG